MSTAWPNLPDSLPFVERDDDHRAVRVRFPVSFTRKRAPCAVPITAGGPASLRPNKPCRFTRLIHVRLGRRAVNSGTTHKLAGDLGPAFRSGYTRRSSSSSVQRFWRRRARNAA